MAFLKPTDVFISATFKTVAESFAPKYLLWLCSIFMLSNPNQATFFIVVYLIPNQTYCKLTLALQRLVVLFEVN